MLHARFLSQNQVLVVSPFFFTELSDDLRLILENHECALKF